MRASFQSWVVSVPNLKAFYTTLHHTACCVNVLDFLCQIEQRSTLEPLTTGHFSPVPNIQLLKGFFFPLFLIHLFHAFSWTEFRTDLIVNKWVFLDTLKRMLERLGRRNWLMKMVSADEISATFAHFVLFLWLWSYPAWAFPPGLIKFILSYLQRIIVIYTCRNVWMPDVCGRLKKVT